MDEEKQETPKAQLCSLRVGLIVHSDEEALRYKREISQIFDDVPNVQIQFSLTNSPPRG